MPCRHTLLRCLTETYFGVDTWLLAKRPMTTPGQTAAALDVSVEEIAHFNPQP